MATARPPGHPIPAQRTHQAVRPAGTPDAADPGRGLDIIAGVPTDYHRFAGSSLDRPAALSDGIFAVVMTLLVLDLHVPVVDGLDTEAALWHELGKLMPRLLTYFLSFLTLGIF